MNISLVSQNFWDFAIYILVASISIASANTSAMTAQRECVNTPLQLK